MNWIPGILTKPIPFDGFGRNLTESECQKLRARGHTLSRRWIVVRHADRPDLGILYYPSRQSSGYDHAGVYVTD
jgi:hypothetical protein